MWLRSDFWVSIFWAQEGSERPATVKQTIQNLRISVLLSYCGVSDRNPGGSGESLLGKGEPSAGLSSRGCFASAPERRGVVGFRERRPSRPAPRSFRAQNGRGERVTPG